jgi:chemotaxis protein CheC
MPEYRKWFDENIDMLKEIGSIGMEHSATALSDMLGMKVTITIPDVYIASVEEAVEQLEFALESEKDYVSVKLGLQGDSKGAIFEVFNKSFALRMMSHFFGNEAEILNKNDEMTLSLIQEIGNITSGSYCNSLASMTGLFIDITIPSHCKDMVEEFKGEIIGKTECILVINNSFLIENNAELRSNFFFVPESDTLEMIITKFKEYYGISA